MQIINENGDILDSGEEGDVAVNCTVERPVGLFTKYVVKCLLLLVHIV